VSRNQLDNLARSMAMLGVAFPLFLVMMYFHLGEASFLGFAFIGLTVIQLSLGPGFGEIALTVAAGALYGALYAMFGGALASDWPMRIAGVLSFLGTGSLLAMAARLLWSQGDEQRLRLRALLTGLTPIVFLVYMPVAFRLLNVVDPDSLDRYLYAFDARLGLQASFVVGTLFVHWPLLKAVSALVYLGLPLAMAGVYVAAPVAPHEPSLIRTFLLLGIVGVILFRVVPAAGPAYAFPDYPDVAPMARAGFLQPIHLNHVLLNAIPSLHTGWALLIYWRARFSRAAIRSAAAVFLFLTLLATLGLGEHYLVDLVVAVPFAVAVRCACWSEAGWTSERWSALVFNAAIVAAWLILLRQGALVGVPPWCAWSMLAFTAGSALWLNEALNVRVRPLRTAAVSLAPAG
jgi:hypothetical protein